MFYLIVYDRYYLPAQGGALTLQARDPFALAWRLLLGRGWVM